MDRSAYEGLGTTSGTAYAPLLFKNANGWNTIFSVQNTDGVAANINVLYRQTNTGQTWNESHTLPPNSAKILSQAGNAQLPNGFVGSALISCSNGQSLALSVHTEKNVWSLDYSGMNQWNVGSQASAPLLFKNYNGYNAGWQIQNLGAQATTLNVTYRQVNGSGVWAATANVEPGASASFDLRDNGQIPDNMVLSGAATSSNGQPLGGTVNEIKYPLNQVLNYVSPGAGNYLAAAPYMLKAVDNWRTGIQVQNLGTQTASVKLQFLDTNGGQRAVFTEGIAAGQSKTWDLANIGNIPNGWIGSAWAYSENGQPIIAIVNEVRTQ